MLRARVLADRGRSRTPRQILGRLQREARDVTVELMTGSPDAEGRTVSHEAMYQYIYALPMGKLAKHGIMLRSKRSRRKPRKAVGERGAPIVGMISIDGRPEEVDDRRVPGNWEGDLIVGAQCKTAAVTLVERTTRFFMLLALPEGKNSASVTDTVIEHVRDLPKMMCGSITWDQGTEMAKHALLSFATNMPVYFAHPRSPWERGTNENTTGWFGNISPRTSHQPYLTAIADEMNDRPRASLDFMTPREAFNRLVVASTP